MDLYLTGSRFFGGFRPDSDHDYIGQYTKEDLEMLLENKYSVGSVFLSKGKEDIFLVNNLEKFVKARNILKELPLSNYSKEYHGYLWKQALDIIGSK
jgi:hypothetical protein